MNINYIFPQTIGISEYGNASNLQGKIADYLKTADPFIYNPHKLPVIEGLMKWIDHEVNEYRHTMQFPDEYECTESWLHDYRLNSYQPWHSHAGNIISAVYIIAANTDTSSPLYFRNPVNDMMNPYNANMDPDVAPIDTQWYNSEQMAYPSITGTLFIFRSYLEHSIKLKDNTHRRIVLALNYNRINRLP